MDNAATTWPKPEIVYAAVEKVLRECGGSYGRGTHSLSLSANELVYEARMLCKELFHAEKPDCICFTSNATEALNLAIKGALRQGDHVITSSTEHNSVTRPLKKMERLGIKTTKINTSPEVGMDLDALNHAFQKNTKLVVCSHISNVTGAINPIKEIGSMCREKGTLFLVDAAQSAGMRKIDVQENYIDLMAFPGHKGLFGPQGTGGLLIREGIVLDTLKEGGTGTHSESFDQPDEKPERYESGTLNLPGISGLAAGVKFILSEGIKRIEEKESDLVSQLITGLSQIEGVRVYGPKLGMPRGSVVSVTIDGVTPGDASMILDSIFHIAARSGLHCARDAHETLGTISLGGTLRISPGYFNTDKDIEQVIDAIYNMRKEL